DAKGQAVWIPLLALFSTTIALSVSFAWSWVSGRDPIIRDSAEFVASLRRWESVLWEPASTPRSAKRLINRLRYMAMAQRTQEVEPTRFDRLRRWLTQTNETEPPPSSRFGEELSEASLVT